MNWQKVKTDLSLAFFSHLFYKIISFFLFMILTRYLTKEAMGAFFFAGSISAFFIVVTQLGLGNYLTREVSQNPEKAVQYFSEVISIRFFFFLFYFILMNGFSLFFKTDLSIIILLTSVSVFFEECYYSIAVIFIGLKRIRYNIIAGVSTRLLLVGIIFLFIFLKKGLVLIITGYLVTNLILASIALFIFRKKIGKPKFVFNIDIFYKILKISIPLFILNVLVVVHYNFDTLMLGLMTSYTAVAMYEAAYKLLLTSQLVTIPVGMIFFPMFSEMVVQQKWNEIKLIYRKLIIAAIMLGSIIAVVIFFTAEFVIPLIFGSKYIDSVPVLRILYLCVPMLYTGNICLIFAKSMSLEKKVIFIMLICILFNIILNLILIPILQANGAAWATIISKTILTLLLLRFNFKIFRESNHIYLNKK